MFGTMHRWGTRTIFGVPVVPDVVITYASRRVPKPGGLDAYLADDSSETRPTISSFNSSNSCTTTLPQSTSLSASTNFTNTYAYQCYKVVRLLRRKNVNICTCITVMAIFREKLGWLSAAWSQGMLVAKFRSVWMPFQYQTIERLTGPLFSASSHHYHHVAFPGLEIAVPTNVLQGFRFCTQW